MKYQSVVVGLGKTGLACVRHLVQRGVEVAVTDNRPSPPGLIELHEKFPHVPVTLGRFSSDLILNAERLIVSPGVSLQQSPIKEAIAKGISVVGDIELFVQNVCAPILAVTGSNGKTTVTTLIGDMLRRAGLNASVCGNIGTPVLDVLNDPTPDVYVIELSSFQLETTHSLQAHAAVLLNISADHMDRYATLKDYLRAKQRIYHQCERAVLNADEPELWQSLELPNRCVRFSTQGNDAQFHLIKKDDKIFLAHQNEILLDTDELRVRGEHQWQDALAALAMAHTLNVPIAPMLNVLREFSGLPHRCQWVAERAGVTWVNDSKGTNVGASVAAIQSMSHSNSRNLILIAGGDAKSADLSPLRDPVQQHVKHVILMGKDAPQIEALLHDVVPVTRVEDMPTAVKEAAQLASSGDRVLLSPACASLDMFRDYQQRGELFMRAVKEL